MDMGRSDRPAGRFDCRVILCAVALAVWATGNGAAQSQVLEPGQALHEFHVALARAGGQAQQAAIARPILARANRTGLDESGRFALAELYFVALMPDSADGAFAPYVTGEDLRARIAVQRRLRIGMAAYDRFDGVEDSLVSYRRRFAPHRADPWHLESAVATLAQYHAKRGDHAAVVRLVMDEIRTLPSDAVFFSHRLPGQFMESFRQQGVADSAIAHMTRVRDAMVATGERSSRGERPGESEHVDGVVHRLEEQLLADLGEREMRRFLRGRLVGVLSGYLAREGERAAGHLEDVDSRTVPSVPSARRQRVVEVHDRGCSIPIDTRLEMRRGCIGLRRYMASATGCAIALRLG